MEFGQRIEGETATETSAGADLAYLFDDCALDLARRELRRGGTPVPVEPQVFDLIAYLIGNRKRVVTKDDLLEGVWGGRIVSESTLNSRINAARVVIGDNGGDQRLIKTLPRKGYRFVGQVWEDEVGVVAVPPRAEVANGTLALEMAEPPKSPANGVTILPGASAALRNAGVEYIDKHRPAKRLRLGLALAGAAGLALVAATLLVVLWPGSGRVAVSPAGPAFDATAVPLISDADRISLATYPARPDAKAVAISRGRFAIVDSAPDSESAKQEALRQCAAQVLPTSQCRIYAVGIEVVWSKASLPLPAPGDLRLEPMRERLVADDVPLVSASLRQRVADDFLQADDHKALALTSGNNLFHVVRRYTRAEATRLAVEGCGDRWQRPCLIVSVDGFATMPFPKLRRLVDIFLPMTATDIPTADRARVAQVYQGAEWRALARGQNGWYPVAGEPSEAAAIDAALQSCKRADDQCRLYAIGNFQVAAN